MSALRIPDPEQPVQAARQQQGAIRVEVHGRYGVRVRRDLPQAPSTPDVPHTHRLVKGPRCEEVALGVEVAAEDVVGVAVKRLEALAGLGVLRR